MDYRTINKLVDLDIFGTIENAKVDYLTNFIDPVKFFENVVKFRNVFREDTIKLTESQKQCLKLLNESNKSLIYSSRRAGKTTIMISEILRYSLLNDKKKIVIMTADYAQRNGLMSTLCFVLKSYLSKLYSYTAITSTSTVRFDNFTTIECVDNSYPITNHKNIDFFYFDEADLIDDKRAYEINEWINQDYNKNMKVVLSSTKLKENVLFYSNVLNVYYNLDKHGWRLIQLKNEFFDVKKAVKNCCDIRIVHREFGKTI